jgi:hypothetical protein
MQKALDVGSQMDGDIVRVGIVLRAVHRPVQSDDCPGSARPANGLEILSQPSERYGVRDLYGHDDMPSDWGLQILSQPSERYGVRDLYGHDDMPSDSRARHNTLEANEIVIHRARNDM